jgi:dipeptidyl-peptidase-4
VERIFGTGQLRPDRFSGEWRDDGESWTVVEKTEEGHDELWEVEAATGERERLVPASELVPEGESEPISIYDWSFSPDGRYVLIFTDAQRVWRARTKGKYWTYDLVNGALRPVSEKPGWQMFAKFGPDSRRVAFVREHDIHVTEVATGAERQLTTSGSEDTINGTTDWVYEEELGLRDAFRWSPDGRRIAYWQLDRSPIPPFYLVDETKLYPELKPVRYPKAGTENSEVRVGSMDLSSGETTWFDAGSPEYIARMEWITGDEVAIQTLNRHQNRLEVRIGDAATGRTRTVLAETDSAWVDVDGKHAWIDDGQRLVWSSDRDGYDHLYLFDRSGRQLRQLTDGDWPVTGFHGVDEARGRVWFQAAVRHPYTRSLGYVTLEGEGPTWVAGPAAGLPCAPPDGEAEGPGGVHEAVMSPDHRHFFHTCSTAALPPMTWLRGADGESVRVLEGNAELRARLDSVGAGSPEFFRVRAADGETELNAWMLRPPQFDPSREHPLLMYVYGGPGIQTVMDAWGGTRQLWHHLMAREGFLVASVDNRGTGARGRDFYKQVYMKLGQLETDDQLAAARQLASRPSVDPDRIGIWGWSYGGYMTLLTTLRSDGAIAAGASVAPVTHWKFYDTIYTERYMRTPSENPEGYRKGAPLNYAGRLESELFIVHGTGDDNVHPQNTVRMVEALQQANEQFRMRIYPNKRHGISGARARVNLFEGLTGFFRDALGGP